MGVAGFTVTFRTSRRCSRHHPSRDDGQLLPASMQPKITKLRFACCGALYRSAALPRGIPTDPTVPGVFW